MKSALWFDSTKFGILTDIGLFIYDSTKSVNISDCKVFFGEYFNVKKVVFDNDSETLFILDDNGRVKKTKIREGVFNSDDLETVLESCLTILKGV